MYLQFGFIVYYHRLSRIVSIRDSESFSSTTHIAITGWMSKIFEGDLNALAQKNKSADFHSSIPVLIFDINIFRTVVTKRTIPLEKASVIVVSYLR